MPLPLKSCTTYRLPSEFEPLYRLLTAQPPLTPAPLGAIKTLGCKEPAPFAPVDKSQSPHNLPYSSLGPLFMGREDWLADLHACLERAPAEGAAATVGKAVHGLGGVGKTRLAVEYAWRHGARHTARLFVTANSPEALDTHLAALICLADNANG